MTRSRSACCKADRLAAGFHAVAHLPDSADEQAVITAARQRSVGLYGMGEQPASTEAAPSQP